MVPENLRHPVPEICALPEPPAPLPEHRAAKVAAVHGKRAKLYEERQQVLNLGPERRGGGQATALPAPGA
jgi:hypothetical protein